MTDFPPSLTDRSPRKKPLMTGSYKQPWLLDPGTFLSTWQCNSCLEEALVISTAAAAAMRRLTGRLMFSSFKQKKKA